MVKCVLIVVAGLSCSITAADESAKESRLDGLVKLLGEVDDASFQRDVLQGIHKALNGRRSVKAPAGWSKVAAKLLKSKDETVRNRALQLGVIFGDPHSLNTLRQRAANTRLPAAERASALQPLVQKQDARTLPLLQKLLDERAMRGTAIRALASFADKTTPNRLLSLYPKLTTAQKRDAVLTLASRPDYAQALLAAVDKKQIATRDVSAFVIRQLSSFGAKKLNARIEKVWGSVRPTSKQRAARMAALKKRLTASVLKKADRSHGRLLFKKTCASCHKLFDDGKAVGPELTGSQRTNVDYLLENILDPNAVIGRDYRMTKLVTNRGRIITGIIKEETTKTLSLQTANQVVLLDKSDIAIRQRSKVSLMPEGQLDKLKFRDIRDLFGYLMGSTQPRLPATEP